ncbi:hypothetical protein UCRPC4_g03616 [Phaeomoniella chlamydospora]|uniref:DUF833 domain-containing protein n=1 Tax=Phaeomoniella chlamydospora TaxID=158046 RepID=A0A0G2EF56_PHACM|nr:hypothetical protein UCRPC4_g03616 [Phaeomoniella chlamydospora]
MCIALISTAHPSYSLILLDNRDEFLNRPTAPAEWWPSPNSHVLGGRDLLRDAQGTWLAVTRDGRIAVLTNFRENTEVAVGAQSRGGMVKAFLTGSDTVKQTTEEFAKGLVASGAPQSVGGFSLVCGRIGQPLAVISNRVTSEKGISWIAGERAETVGLSNAAYGDRSWAKVVSGEKLLEEAIETSTKQGENEEQIIQRFLVLLSRDTLPKEKNPEDGLETHIDQLRNTIFVPTLGRREVQTKSPEELRAANTKEKAKVVEKVVPGDCMSGLYGTQKQTVILVKHDGRVRFFERTLFDRHSAPIPEGNGDIDIEFNIVKQ